MNDDNPVYAGGLRFLLVPSLLALVCFALWCGSRQHSLWWFAGALPSVITGPLAWLFLRRKVISGFWIIAYALNMFWCGIMAFMILVAIPFSKSMEAIN